MSALGVGVDSRLVSSFDCSVLFSFIISKYDLRKSLGPWAIGLAPLRLGGGDDGRHARQMLSQASMTPANEVNEESRPWNPCMQCPMDCTCSSGDLAPVKIMRTYKPSSRYIVVATKHLALLDAVSAMLVMPKTSDDRNMGEKRPIRKRGTRRMCTGLLSTDFPLLSESGKRS